MFNVNNDENINEIFRDLKIDCKNCFGFCCVALYFSKIDGFPNDKDAGTPCKNLKDDFSCFIHSKLRQKGLKGCTIYDCFGAGQKVAQKTYKGVDWKANTKLSKEMYETFLVVRNLHEMLWYLMIALSNQATKEIHEDIKNIITETEVLSNLEGNKLILLDVTNHRNKVNKVLLKASGLIDKESIRKKNTGITGKKNSSRGFDFIGKDLRKFNLIGADFKGALLIAANLSNSDLSYANFIGADLRDADLSNANLSESVFLTQIQINSAKGNSLTKLPDYLNRPSYWESK